MFDITRILFSSSLRSLYDVAVFCIQKPKFDRVFLGSLVVHFCLFFSVALYGLTIKFTENDLKLKILEIRDTITFLECMEAVE